MNRSMEGLITRVQRDLQKLQSAFKQPAAQRSEEMHTELLNILGSMQAQQMELLQQLVTVQTQTLEFIASSVQPKVTAPVDVEPPSADTRKRRTTKPVAAEASASDERPKRGRGRTKATNNNSKASTQELEQFRGKRTKKSQDIPVPDEPTKQEAEPAATPEKVSQVKAKRKAVNQAKRQEATLMRQRSGRQKNSQKEPASTASAKPRVRQSART